MFAFLVNIEGTKKKIIHYFVTILAKVLLHYLVIMFTLFCDIEFCNRCSIFLRNVTELFREMMND